MCGITGFYAFGTREPISRPLLRRARDLQAHRGPNQAGEYFDDAAGLALGVRRLSIIDLATGDQPIANEDGSVTIVFNGEIYNYRELREDLRQRGHHFATASDTEVVVHAYEEFGLDCPARFNGIFAFAVWDARRQRLFLARDHFGVKPLYYTVAGGVFRFGSELKSILADPAVPRDVDPDALNLCLTFRYTPSPWTLLSGIKKLPPAGYAVVDAGGLTIGRYWANQAEPLRSIAASEAVEQLRARLDGAVQRQMVSDVPISLSLSSGVDSSTLLALMARSSSQPVRAFTVGFAGREEVSEVGPASETARLFGARFSGRTIASEDYAAFLERYIWHLEEPIGNESSPAYYFVAAMAQAEGIKVLLNGQGPDETFGGYARHLGAAYGGLLGALPRPFVQSMLVPLAERLPVPETYRRLAYALEGRSEVEQLLSMYTFVAPSTRARLLSPALRRRVDPDVPRAFVADQLAQAPPGTRLERMLHVDTRTSLSDNLLLCEDKMSMAASVEARVPFLDLEFMELAERVPGRLKVRLGRGKYIHRRVCAGMVPQDVVRRPKIGFASAVDLWLRQRLGRQLCQAILAPDSFTRAYLDRDVVETLIREHDQGQRNHQRILFLLLSMEAWYRAFILGESPLGGVASS